MAETTHILKIVIQVMDKATAGITQVDKATQNIDKNVNNINKKLGTFDARLLSLLFGGMALQRAFGGMLRGIVDTFLRSEDQTSGLTQATTRLSASWEFLKFSIMDALNTDFFINMIDGIVRFLNWLSQLDDEWKIIFLAISGGLFIIGTAMMLIGQIKLGWDAIFGMGGFLGSTSTIISKLGWGGIFGWLLLIAGVAYIIVDNWDTIKTAGINLWNNLKSPLSSIKESLDKITELAGFEDFFDLISSVGMGAFLVLGAAILNAAFLADLLILLLKNIAIQLNALIHLDFKKASNIELLKDMVDWTDRWTNANADYIDMMQNLGKQEKISSPAMSVESAKKAGGFTVLAEDPFQQFSNIDESIMSVDKNLLAAQESILGYSETIETDLMPKVSSMISQITGKDGFIDSIKKQGTEMDILATDKTENTLASSNKRIEQNEKEIESWNRLKRAYESYLSAGNRLDSLDLLSNASSVSD